METSVLSSLGVGNINISMSQVIAGILFSSIGFVAFAYGKKTESYKSMGIGATLMLYMLFIHETKALWLVGALLTAALFFFRD